MTPAAERPRAAAQGPHTAGGGRHTHTASGGRHTHTAFGLQLDIDPRIAIAGLARAGAAKAVTGAEAAAPTAVAAETTASGTAAAASPPTRIRLDPAELRRRWAAIATTPVRVREVAFEGRPLRTIDFAQDAGYLLWNRDHGRVLISADGRELLCESDAGNAQWTAIVAAQALPLAATLRGLEVLHASGVVVGGKAVLISGAAGAGKSSLAAALMRAGGLLLSDDAVALELREGAGGAAGVTGVARPKSAAGARSAERTLVAHAGSLALQLRAPEDERLSASERAALGDAAGTAEDKQRYVSVTAPPPAPLGGLFLLERSAAQPALERVEAVSPFALLASTFNLSVRTPQRLRRQLDVVAAIAQAGLVYRLRVQPGVDATALAALVREHMEL